MPRKFSQVEGLCLYHLMLIRSREAVAKQVRVWSRVLVHFLGDLLRTEVYLAHGTEGWESKNTAPEW